MTPATREGPLVVVAVTESVNPAFANRHGIAYLSPPQTYDQARSLVQLLTGAAEEPARDEWTIPIPGGTRTVTIRGRTRPSTIHIGDGPKPVISELPESMDTKLTCLPCDS